MVVNGEWTEAMELASVTRLEGSPLEKQMAISILGRLAYCRGDNELAWTMIKELMPRGPDSQPEDALFPYAMETMRLAARMALDARDRDAAHDWVEAHDRWLTWSGAVRGRADSALLRAQLFQEQNRFDEAHASTVRGLELASDPRQPLALIGAHRMLGDLHLQAGQSADAQEQIQHAIELAEACEAPYDRALALLSQIRICQRDGRTSEIEELLLEVNSIANQLVSPKLREEAERMSRSTIRPAGSTLLTPREFEVLRLVTEGLTDAEVAERLFISPRTVSQHLRSVYSKLGVSSRTQATSVAVRENLV